MKNSYNKRNVFDASYKLAMIEEYYNQQETCSISKFALDHGICKSTFHKWIHKFQHSEMNDKVLRNKTNKFIEISLPTKPSTESKTSVVCSESNSSNDADVYSNNMRLSYKGAILEFNSNNLHQVMNELKQW